MNEILNLSQETLEQAYSAAREASKGYALVQDGDTVYGLGWTVSLDKPWGTMTAAYETEDGELLTFHVNLAETGLLANQSDLGALVEDLLGLVGEWEDWTGWTLLSN